MSKSDFKMFYQAFSARLEIVEAIPKALAYQRSSLACIKEANDKLENILSEIGRSEVEEQYRAFHNAVTIFLQLINWKFAIRNAEPEAQRYLDSAKLISSEFEKSPYSDWFNKFLEQIENLRTVEELGIIENLLKLWNLPLLLFTNRQEKAVAGRQKLSFDVNPEVNKKLETTVAFLKFEIDGKPAMNYNYLKPGISYDLTIEVRVSNWPEAAGALKLSPISIDKCVQNWLPTITLRKPQGKSPFNISRTMRIVLEIAHSFGSRPYEFIYAAEFENSINYPDVTIIGHRRLLLEGCDVASNPLTGFSNADTRLLQVRNKLRNFPGIGLMDISNTMIVLGGFGNIAGQALRDNIFPTVISEKQFQKKVCEMLRSHSDIGEDLQIHPEAGGGITDLTFHGIPIELKVDDSKNLSSKDCDKFFDQTVAYAIGLGKQIGVLAVLDTACKNTPVGDLESDIEVFCHQSESHSPVAIIVVIVRGVLPKPSSYSR